ncbi:MAG: efflux RND transporter permease subunit [Candidatus Micrarchaeia archaeon]
MKVQTDMTKEMPQQLEVYQVSNLVTAKLGGQDTVLIAVTLDESSNEKNAVIDIRDPRVINYLIELENSLKEESIISEITSAGSYFEYLPHSTLDEVKRVLDSYPQLTSFFSSDYKTTVFYLKSDLGGGENKINELENTIREKLASSSEPVGIKTSITGNPSIRSVIFEILIQDSILTLSIAIFLIFLLLVIILKSVSKTLTVLAPLIIGLTWTLGTLSWLDIPLSIATVGISAMILGLGVEYGIFMLSRYTEERDKGATQLHSLKETVPNIGSALLGSGGTTIVGFIALTLSVVPMLQKLGFSLALGIFYTLASTIVLMPVIIVLGEKAKYKLELLYAKKILHKRKIRKEMREKWKKI